MVLSLLTRKVGCEHKILQALSREQLQEVLPRTSQVFLCPPCPAPASTLCFSTTSELVSLRGCTPGPHTPPSKNQALFFSFISLNMFKETISKIREREKDFLKLVAGVAGEGAASLEDQ